MLRLGYQQALDIWLLLYLEKHHVETQNSCVCCRKHHCQIHFVTLIGFNKSDSTHEHVTQQTNVEQEEHLQIHIENSRTEVSTNESIANCATCNQHQQCTTISRSKATNDAFYNDRLIHMQLDSIAAILMPTHTGFPLKFKNEIPWLFPDYVSNYSLTRCRYY